MLRDANPHTLSITKTVSHIKTSPGSLARATQIRQGRTYFISRVPYVLPAIKKADTRSMNAKLTQLGRGAVPGVCSDDGDLGPSIIPPAQ